MHYAPPALPDVTLARLRALVARTRSLALEKGLTDAYAFELFALRRAADDAVEQGSRALARAATEQGQALLRTLTTARVRVGARRPSTGRTGRASRSSR